MAVPDLDAAHVFVNLAGGTRFAPWHPDSVYALVNRLRRDLAGIVPAAWTPHWLRHSHVICTASAPCEGRGFGGVTRPCLTDIRYLLWRGRYVLSCDLVDQRGGPGGAGS